MAWIPQREAVVRQTGTRNRMRRRSAAASTSAAAATTEEVIAESDEDVAEVEYAGKASKKKERKRQEREAQRQADDAAHESRQQKQDHYTEMRRRKDEERETQERLLEEEAKARQAKEEETAALEFEKWKGEFSVDAEGTTADEMQEGGQGLLSEFVEYIKKNKCVPLEDLAAEFKLRTQLLGGQVQYEAAVTNILIEGGVLQDCINRITSLESMGRLSGVMDERGKYIYISAEEMRAVADYIKRQGRVSISHLASRSNQFIDLEPKSQFVEEIGNVDGIPVA
ncbi:hypothetical protein ACLOJK_039550 [Asimina triloba]